MAGVCRIGSIVATNTACSAQSAVAKRDWAEERRFEEGLQRLKRWVV